MKNAAFDTRGQTQLQQPFHDITCSMVHSKIVKFYRTRLDSKCCPANLSANGNLNFIHAVDDRITRMKLTLYSPEAIILLHQITWSWYTGRWWVGCYIWFSKEGTGWGRSLLRLLFTVPNLTAHPSTASVLITALLYNGLLLGSFNAPIKG